jgi:hypothetical protein
VPPERAGRWAVVALWTLLVVTAGPPLADALATRDRPVQVVASAGLWAAWAVGLGAALVPRTVSLTAVRIVMPAAVPATAWALAATGADRPLGVAGLGTAAAGTVLVLSAFVGDGFVNGSSYGDERRLPLRPPARLLAAPVPLAWAACVAGAAAGPLLLASGRWVAGAAAAALGFPAAALAARALHGLARRWLVLVPAGLVVHDPLALVEPVLCTRAVLRRLGPAPAGTAARDLTAGATGLAVEIDLSEAVPVALRRGRGAAETAELTSFLVAPSRPGAALREARRRRLPVA